MPAISKPKTRIVTVAAALAAAAFVAGAPALADDYTQYPLAVAEDAAETMAKYGGVVIDVRSKFPARFPKFTGCGVVKFDASPKVPDEEREFNFTNCAEQAITIPPPPTTPNPPPNVVINRAGALQ